VNRRYKLAVVGADARTNALAERLAPDSPFREGPFAIAAWAVSPAGDDAAEVATQARRAGAPVAASWRQAAAGDADAVFVGGPRAGRAEAVTAALGAGKAVLCPPPVALDAASWAEVEAARRSTGAVLLVLSDLAAGLPGRRALASVQAGELGRLHAVFLASRTGRDGATDGSDVLDELGWEALDYLAACVGAPCERVCATGGSLFGAGTGTDTVLANLRFAGETIGTLELARSLPAALAAAGPEVEVELAGTEAALRVEPYKRTVEVFGPEPQPGARRRHWPAHAVAAMLEDLRSALEGGPADPDALTRQREVLAMHAALRASLQHRDVVRVGG
jgi:predicted dehydrogenase